MADIEMTAQPSTESHISKRDIIEFKPERDSANDIRNALLVVAALIASATFAAGVNPPGGVWQDNENNHVAGKSVLASHSKDSFTMFLFSNTRRHFLRLPSWFPILSVTFHFFWRYG